MTEFIYRLLHWEYIPCRTCVELKLQLEDEKRRSNRLLEKILEKPESIPEPIVQENLKPIQTFQRSVNQARRLAEIKDLERASADQKVAELKLENERLEKELNVG